MNDARTHRQRFGYLAAGEHLTFPPPPSPSSWSGYDPLALAHALVDRAEAILQDPDAAGVLAERWLMSEEAWEEVQGDVWTPEDLPDLLGYPMRGYDGKRLTKAARRAQARGLVDLVAQQSALAPAWDYTSPSRAFRPVRAGYTEALPRRLVVAIVYDALTHDRKSRIKLIPRDQARAFIEKHHTNMPWIHDNGWIYSIGLYNGRRLAAVATAHTVTAGWPTGKNPQRPPRQVPRYVPYDEVDPDADVERVPLDPRNILELTRVASDGTIRGASSMLAARILKLTPFTRRGDPDGPWLFVTYSLQGEAGSTYKGLRELGLRPVAIRAPRRAKGGARAGAARRAHDDVAKIRWEAGPAALPADWSVLGWERP